MSVSTDQAPRLLVFTTLYPNRVQPRHGVFVEQRLRQLLKTAAVRARVIAPVPWFPFPQPRFGRYAEFARVPRAERREGVEVRHPRYPVLPKIGMRLAPRLLAGASLSPLRRLQRDYPFELIDAHYFYPDGVAAAILGEKLQKPVVITARGSDLNVIAEYPGPRRSILWAAARAAGLITVSGALKQRLVDLGVAAERIQVLRNGVDLERFTLVPPCEKTRLREALGFGALPALLSVGNLVPLKGHDLVIRALAELPAYRLWVIGAGPEERALRELAVSLGLAGRVRFTGNLTQPRLAEYYAAADALVLASSSEGMPNVLLEAMACGLPVVATRVGGAAEVVTDPAAGVLLDRRSPAAIATALRGLAAAAPDRRQTRRHAERFDWAQTSAGQTALFRRLLRA